jgi:zinc/manganese transport system substrate-binding protein
MYKPNRLLPIAAAMLAAAVLQLGLAPVRAEAKLRVVASLTDLGSIAASVGGDRVEVSAIARPNADAHRVETLPSYMVRVSKAQLYLKVGLGLDQWADQIIDGSRNGGLRVVDCSTGIEALDKPTGKVDASLGDVHPNGNPHYWLDPRNGGIIARQIAGALAELDPEHAGEFAANAEALAREADALATRGAASMQALTTRAIFTYHASWIYFTHAFGLEVAATVEPVPGIPPTGKHLQSLVDIAKGRGIKILLQEPYFSGEAGQFLSREADIRAITVAASCDEAKAGSWLAHIEQVLDAITSTGA